VSDVEARARLERVRSYLRRQIAACLEHERLVAMDGGIANSDRRVLEAVLAIVDDNT
jgi:hypothetical protein